MSALPLADKYEDLAAQFLKAGPSTAPAEPVNLCEARKFSAHFASRINARLEIMVAVLRSALAKLGWTEGSIARQHTNQLHGLLCAHSKRPHDRRAHKHFDEIAPKQLADPRTHDCTGPMLQLRQKVLAKAPSTHDPKRTSIG